MNTKPDPEPDRLQLLDVAAMTEIEAYRVLVLLAEDSDPAVVKALLDATRVVLQRTRG